MIGRPKRSAIGFTLLELVLVLAAIGLVSAVVVTGLAGASQSQSEREAVREIERALVSARVDAMRTAEERAVAVEFGEGLLAIEGVERVRRVPRAGLTAVDEGGMPVDRLEVRFGADGRTGVRLWRLANADVDLQSAYDLGLLGDGWASKEDLLAGRGGWGEASVEIEGRLWLVRFDPISGAPGTEVVDGR